MCVPGRTNRAWSGPRLPREPCDQFGYFGGTRCPKIWLLRSLLTLRPFGHNPVRKGTTVYTCRNKKFTNRRKIGDGILDFEDSWFNREWVWCAQGSLCKLCRLPAQLEEGWNS